MPYQLGEPQERYFFKPSKRCKICNLIFLDPALKGRIEKTSSYTPVGLPIAPFIREFDLKWPNWYAHLKRHHYPLRGKLAEKRELTGEDTPLLGQVIEAETVVKDNYTAAWDEVINVGLQEVASGRMEVTGTMLLKAASDKATFLSKKQDQKLDIAKMVYAFASGAGGGTDGAGQGVAPGTSRSA
jgi:hypothetical protein